MFGLSDLAVKLIGAAALALFGFAGGCWVTYKVEQGTIQKMHAADAEAVAEAVRIGWARRDAQDHITNVANTGNGNAQAAIAATTQETIRYVPKYITVHDDAGCALPDGFGRLLDAAQLGVAPDSLPDGAGQPGGAPPALTLSAATGLLAQVLGDYASLRARVLNAHAAWQAQAAVTQPVAAK